MPDATTTTLNANTNDHVEQSPFPIASNRYQCSLCHVSFCNNQEQRMHMKEPWHVYNIKRRIASLPPIPSDAFNSHFEKPNDINEPPVSSDDKEGSDDDEDEQPPSPFHCLFCTSTFPNSDAGLTSNVEHMHTAHGLSIPNPDQLIDMQSFIGYLAVTVRTWHECLYCGVTKSSTASIMSHMRDKGHCLLNLDREPGLWDFWDRPRPRSVNGHEIAKLDLASERREIDLEGTEIRFDDGRVISSRYAASSRTRRKDKADSQRSLQRTASLPSMTTTARDLPPYPPSRNIDSSQTTTTAPQPQQQPPLPPNRSLTRTTRRGDELSTLGLTPQQRAALLVAEKKAQRSEAIASKSRQWVYARGANSQKHDQLDGLMKMGRQNHKLMPR